MIEAQCRCGAIGLKIAGEPVVQLYCHCDDCQAAHGAAYVPAAIYPAHAVEVVRGKPAPMVVKATSGCAARIAAPIYFPRLRPSGCEASAVTFLPRERSNRNSMFNARTLFCLLSTICLTIKASRRRSAELRSLSAGRALTLDAGSSAKFWLCIFVALQGLRLCPPVRKAIDIEKRLLVRRQRDIKDDRSEIQVGKA